MNYKKLCSAAIGYLAFVAVVAAAGPLVNAATNINAEITGAAIAIIGAVIIGFTLVSMTGGLGSRLIVSMIELVAIVVLVMNASNIGNWFRF